ncbi:MAG: glycosyltransferase family 39 protein [Verrucomicrobiota bacterium]
MLDRLKRFWDRVAPETGRWIFAVALVLFALLVWYLIDAKKPWDEKTLARIAEREAEGKFWQARDYVTVWFWYAAALNSVILLGVLGTARWWGKRRESVVKESSIDRTHRTNKAYWVGFAVVILVALAYRAPRLTHSFWNDEEYAFRTYVWGVMTVQEGEWVRDKPDWQESIFRNKLNNHIFATVVARVSAEVGAFFTGIQVNEVAVRLLPMLAAIGGIVITMLWLRNRGSPWEGVAVGIVMALMPWHIRYSVEMRGYAWLLLFVPLAWWAGSAAFRTNRWSAWVAYGVAQLFAFLSSPGIVYPLIVGNLLIFFFVFRDRGRLARFLVSNAMSALLALQILAPSVPQIRKYLAEDEDFVGHFIGTGWLADLWTHLCFGAPWVADEIGAEAGMSVSAVPGASLLLLGLLPLLCIAGLVWSFLRQRVVFVGVGSVLGGGVLLVAWTMASGGYMHSWYVMYLLLPVGVFLGLGTFAIATFVGFSRKAISSAVLVAVLLVYVWATHSPRSAMAFRERQPIRDAARFVRGSDLPGERDVFTASMGTSRRQILSYDPSCKDARKVEDLREILAEANKENAPMSVYVGGLKNFAEGSEESRMIDFLTEVGFQPVKQLKGLETMFSYTILSNDLKNDR